MIAKWQMKAIAQKAISFLPKKEKINYWFQKNITKGVTLTDEYFEYKITHASDHLRFFKTYSDKDLKECTVLELGTGWYPIVPIALFLSDLKNIFTLDLSNWMSKESLKITCNKFIEWRQKGELKKFLPIINEENWNTLKILAMDNQEGLSSMCQQLNLNNWIGDARNTPFEANYIDLICSNNTFEHIPKTVLNSILIEFKSVIHPNGVMSHFIDMSDHFAHFDQSINIYNFLRFSDQAWGWIDNSIQPQNRMRFKDYKEIYRKLMIPITDEEIREGSVEALKEISLDSKFGNYKLEELAISHGYIISKMDKK